MNTHTSKAEENNDKIHIFKVFEQVLAASQSIQSAVEQVIKQVLSLRNLQNYVEVLQTIKEENEKRDQKTIEILRTYKWFITPNLPQMLILNAVKNSEKRISRHKINRLYVEHYTTNNCEHLEYLVSNWATNKIFKPRMKIFRDCISVIKNSKRKYNPSNIVIPTLFSQIDGIMNEFMMQEGLSFVVKKGKGKWTDKNGKVVNRKGWFRDKTQNLTILDSANNILLNIMFQTAYTSKALQYPFTFSRHKVIHGEFLHYGKIDNTIRAFLILDFLAILSAKQEKNYI